MKKDDIKNSFKQLKPNEAAKHKMLSNIKNDKKKIAENRKINFKIFILVLLLGLFLLVAGIVGYKNLINNTVDIADPNTSEDADSSMDDAEIGILGDQFFLGNKQYNILEEEKVIDYGFPTEISDEDIGDNLATITALCQMTLVTNNRR